MKHRRHLQIHRCGNEGESLVTVLVAVAILAVGFSTFATAFSNVARGDRDGQMRASFRDVEPGFKLYMLRQIRSYSRETGCDPESFHHYFSDTPIGHWALPRLLTASPSLDAKAPKNMAAAASRCGESVFADPNGSDFHFCVGLERLREREPTSSFLAGERPFAEVRVRLVDLPTGAPVRCGGMWSQANAGLTVTYGVHWARPQQRAGRQFYSYLGWFYATN